MAAGVLLDPVTGRPLDAQLKKSKQGREILRLLELGGKHPRLVSMAQTLTQSGNEITDAVRAAAASWGTAQLGGQVDDAAIPGGWFINRAATNLFRRGQCDSTTDWNTKAAGVTRSIDATVAAPVSPQSMKFVCDGTGAFQGCSIWSATGQAAAPGVLGVGGIWFSGVAGQQYALSGIWINTDASNTAGTATIFTAQDGSRPLITAGGKVWEWITDQAVAVAAGKTGDLLRLQIYIQGTRTETFWVAHGMLEKGHAVVAPYVASSGGSTSTQAAAWVETTNPLLSSAQGAMVVRLRMGYGSTDTENASVAEWAAHFSDGTSSNRIGLRRDDATGEFDVLVHVGGVLSGFAQQTHAYSRGDALTAAMLYTSTQVGISLDGAAATMSNLTGGLPPGLNLIQIGNALRGQQIDSRVMWVAFFAAPPSNADLALLAALGDHDPSFAGLAVTPTSVWAADTSSYEVPLVNTVAPAVA